jgi:hypothetical protein
MHRCSVEERLEEEGLLPPSKDEDETAAAFWARVEQAGQLAKALELYDEFAEDAAEWIHRPRETKRMFADRIEREGRQAEVERDRNEMQQAGYSSREIHKKLVYHFQPLDGTLTRPWETPDPWEEGRLFRKKEDQERLLAEAKPDDYSREAMAMQRVECAEWRREERVALANARRRARELKTSAAAETQSDDTKAEEANKPSEPEVTEAPVEVKDQKESATADDEPKTHGKWIVVDRQGHMKWVSDAKS